MASQGRKRQALSLGTKMEIIAAVEAGKQRAAVARQFRIVSSTLSTILKNREGIVSAFCSSKFQPTTKRFRTGDYMDVDEAVLSWYRRVKAKQFSPSITQIRDKAREFAQTLGHETFIPSNGWVWRFRARHGILKKSIATKSFSTDIDKHDTTLQPRNILSEYDARNIFAADEMSLFYRLTPDQTLNFKDELCHDGKYSKERVTVMLCANLDGTEKLRPFVIGKYKKPRCLKGVQSLPVDYSACQNAWMLPDLFATWVQDLDNDFTLLGRKVILLVASCAAHPRVLHLKSIKLMFLPTTCEQFLPVGKDFQMSLRLHYRQRLVQHLLYHYDAGDTPQPITLKQAMDLLYGAWQQVHPKCLAKGILKADLVIQDPALFQSPASHSLEDPSVNHDEGCEEASSVKVSCEGASPKPPPVCQEQIPEKIEQTPEKIDQPTDHQQLDQQSGHQEQSEALTTTSQNQAAASGMNSHTHLSTILQTLSQKFEKDESITQETSNDEELDQDLAGQRANLWARAGHYMDLAGILFQDYVQVDSDVQCREVSLNPAKENEKSSAGPADHQQGVDLPFLPPTTSEAFNCLFRLRDYLYSSPETSDEHFAALARLETHLHQCREKTIAQRNITYVIM